jgi:hypothetical protein
MKTKLLYLLITLFALNADAQVISMIGSTSPSGSWSVDTNLTTTDNITYFKNNVVLTTATDPATTGLKFRQDGQWTTNWGNSNFPSGTAVLNGANILTIAGIYDVTFNRINGTYTFIPVIVFPSIGIWGPAVDSQNGYAGPDVDMITTDGITYTLSGFYFSSGNAYFRQDDNSSLVWGSTSFPTGTAVSSGPSLFIPGNEWFVTFNRLTGEYSFEFPKISIMGTAALGWDTDLFMETTNGEYYTINYPSGFAIGECKFRKNQDWNTNWGGTTFPTGVGTFLSFNNIIVSSVGYVSAYFNRNTLEYGFSTSLANSEEAISNLKIYPNPTNTNWTISNSTDINSVQLFDVNGKELQLFEPNTSEFNLSSTSLSNGIYFIKVKSGLDFKVQKIIKN